MDLLVKCDRCGRVEEICDKPQRKLRSKRLNIFIKPTKCKTRDVDLCFECRRELMVFTNLAESYFMNNKDNPSDIFEKAKYYKE